MSSATTELQTSRARIKTEPTEPNTNLKENQTGGTELVNRPGRTEYGNRTPSYIVTNARVSKPHAQSSKAVVKAPRLEGPRAELDGECRPESPAYCRLVVGEYTGRFSLRLEETEEQHELITSSFMRDELRVVRNPGMLAHIEAPPLVPALLRTVGRLFNALQD